jgi:hypothetical protein
VKYIESKPGAPFEFVVNKTSRFKRYGHHFAYAAQVDGEQWNSTTSMIKRERRER